MIQTVLIRKEQMMSSRWSGGTTTQIDLYPEGTTYGARDFTFRVSSAVIEESPSQFTALPDYQRWITMLSGPVVLRHELESEIDQHELQPLQVYRFDGGTPTSSVGEAKDFNLMLRKGLVGNMTVFSIGPEADSRWIARWLAERSPEIQGHLAVYWPETHSAAQGSSATPATQETALRISVKNDEVLLNRGDYLRLSGAVKALKEVQLALAFDSSLLLLYMET